MHLALLLIGIVLAIVSRVLMLKTSSGVLSWHRSLSNFLVPPLLILSTALAIMMMGAEGTMFQRPVNHSGYGLALIIWVTVCWIVIQKSWSAWHLWQRIATLPLYQSDDVSGRCLQTSVPFAGRVGIWRSQLVISQGLIENLTKREIEAVLVHEQAHEFYRDTFFFFVLGCVQRLFAWMPGTEILWNELLLLREIRADHWAAEKVEPLLLAETLFKVVSLRLSSEQDLMIAFGEESTTGRLEQRINALLELEPRNNPLHYSFIAGISIVGCIPLLTMLCHQ
ncbi:MAG: M56 family metallopeptidase [Cyanobacteria bacterium P01_H01_bin.15]